MMDRQPARYVVAISLLVISLSASDTVSTRYTGATQHCGVSYTVYLYVNVIQLYNIIIISYYGHRVI